ncbi:BglG family transcription antiterminator [Pectinatus haikarae]|uniref:Lichenan operon transcriptional antiterminator n=1 Tax=Pectinatus haikarae TaxID=349096 RepID=A0ABT9Y804_9FIRM|nr:BglG family transcription antiterminator [Pectinatus haikarae]MDQ0203965.1 lichenan operon transcriptional antiterminator [Pectinatus haikarae]
MVKLKKRSKRIFELLKNYPNGITGEQMANQLGVSSRTIRSDIKFLQELLEQHNVNIIAVPNKGYSLKDTANLGQLEDELSREDNINFETSEERVNYIIVKLLENTFSGNSITQMELADELFVSISTLKAHLNDVKKIFSKYDLKIVQYKGKGMIIAGEEIKVRYCMSEIINKHNFELFYQKILPDANMAELDKIIRKILNQKKLQLADDAKENLCIHTAIAVQRSKYNKTVLYSASLAQKIGSTFEYDVAKDIVDEIYAQNGIDLSYAEIYYIAQCLLASKKIFDAGESTDKAHVKKLVDIILQEIHDKMAIDFTEDEYLRDGLTLHLNIALTRIEFHMIIRNELLDTIKNDYPLAFQMGVIAGKVVEEYDNIKINENEIGYIALHFGAAISRTGIKENRKVKNVVIVCSAGLGMSVLLKAKIEEHFHNRLNIMKIIPGYEVDGSIMDNTDFVFTTVPLKEIHSDKVIMINHMLKKEDITKIEQKVFQKDKMDKTEIEKFFSSENFYVNKSFTEKNECINFLTDQAIQKGLMTAKIKELIFEREEMASTSIGDLAAIPHPMYNENNNSFISVLILNKPIMWDDLPVQVVFLLNIGKNKASLWETMFLKLYNYIKLKSGINSMLKNKSYDVFLEEFIDMF